jgi:glycogen debranching enzyme
MYEWSQWRQQRGWTNSRPAYYEEQSKRCKESFRLRFWYAPGSYLYDGVDGPGGDDTAFRPNQLLALSLRYPVLDKEHWTGVFDLITQRLLTPYGLRTLAPEEAGYHGQLTENREEQLRALHLGSAWPWLIGPYVDAILNIQNSFSTGEQKEARKLTPEYWWLKGLQRLEPFRRQLREGLLGMVGGVYDGDSPQQAGYNVTSALSIGEILRVYSLLAQKDTRRQSVELVLSRSSSVSRD